MSELINRVLQRVLKAIGNFAPLDEKGFIVNDSSLRKIPTSWQPVLEIVPRWYCEKEGDDLHSLYLRGSVPRGTSQDFFSDLDMVALVKRNGLRWEMAAWKAEMELKIQKDFPFVNGVEVMLSSYSPNFYEVNPQLAMVLRTQSVCLFGTDLLQGFPKVKPGKKMMLHYKWLASDLAEFLNKKQFKLADGQEMMKLLLRVGFELVMEREKKFTADLYLCYRSFSSYYPMWELKMKQVLILYLNPIQDVPFLKIFVSDLGFWLQDQVKRIIGQ